MSENNEPGAASQPDVPTLPGKDPLNPEGREAAGQESVLKAEDALRLIVQSGEAPAAYPLWNQLSATACLEVERQLARLDPASLQYFSPLDLALTLQWLFARHDIETIDITLQTGGFELTLFNVRHKREEYARIFHAQVPDDLLQALSETLEGREINKVRLCTLGTFSEQHWKVQKEYPSLLEFWDREALAGYLLEAQLLSQSPRIQSRRGLPARTARSFSGGRQRSKPAPAARPDPARLRTQFIALTKQTYLSEPLLQIGVLLTGLAFGFSFLLPLPGGEQATLLLGAAVIVISLLRLYTGHRRRRRFRQLWSLLNSSSDAFEIGMPHIFRMAGYQVERVRRYRSRMDKERMGRRGIVARLRRNRQASVAYCASPPVALTAMDIGVCEAEMEKHNTARGMVVGRGVFSVGAMRRAGLDRIALVDGRALRNWLR